MSVEDTAKALQQLGLTDWESRVYLGLLEEAPVSGYSVAKRSGVPRSKIYEVLESLLTKGVVHVSRGEPLQYGPVPPSELISDFRRRYHERLDAAEAAIERHVAPTTSNAVIWDIQGRIEILARARGLIHQARRRLMLELWSADASELRDDLREAAERGVEIIVVAYGDVDLPFAQVYPHPSTDEVTAGLGGRWLVVSTDDQEALAGNVEGGSASRAALTSHPGLVVPITELIKHDLYKLEMLRALGSALEEEFGQGLIRLRERFGSPGTLTT